MGGDCEVVFLLVDDGVVLGVCLVSAGGRCGICDWTAARVHGKRHVETAAGGGHFCVCVLRLRGAFLCERATCPPKFCSYHNRHPWGVSHVRTSHTPCRPTPGFVPHPRIRSAPSRVSRTVAATAPLRFRSQLAVLTGNRSFLYLLSAYGANVGMCVCLFFLGGDGRLCAGVSSSWRVSPGRAWL